MTARAAGDAIDRALRAAPAALVALGLLLAPGAARAQAPAPGPAIGVGDRVQLEYTLTDDTGQVLDSNAGRGPLTYTQGEHQIIPGLEQALLGMRVGEEKRLSVRPEDAYGPVDPEAQSEIPREMLPPDAQTAGAELVARSPDGETRLVRVKEVKEATVVIDLNHPLAGKTLHFAVKILSVDASP